MKNPDVSRTIREWLESDPTIRRDYRKNVQSILRLAPDLQNLQLKMERLRANVPEWFC